MQILFLGPQGSGKGTQSKKLADKTHLPHLSSGDLLRQAVADKTAAGQQAKQFMDAGQLVPDSTLIAMFAEKLSTAECSRGFILDGFPRNIPQAKALDALLDGLKKPLTAVINLHIEDALAMERMTGRRMCSNQSCGAIYHIKFSPPAHANLCDLCGSALIQRSDDQEEPCRKRLEVYHQQTEPLIGYYGAKQLLKTIEAGQDPETVFADILEALKLTVSSQP
jgi:adenylate kinase